MRHFKQVFIIGIVVVVALTVLAACDGKDDREQSFVPGPKVCTHGDSIAMAARFTGNFEYFLAVTDSLAEAGELSPIRADGYRGVAYFQMGQMDKCIEYFRRVVSIENPPAEDFWEYVHAGTNLVIMLTTDRDYDNAMHTALQLIDKLKDVNSATKMQPKATMKLISGCCKPPTTLPAVRWQPASKPWRILPSAILIIIWMRPASGSTAWTRW